MFPPKKTDGPPPLDTPGKKPAALAPMPDEGTETPADESTEEYGAKLLGDMTKPLMDLGLAEDEAKTTLADILDAAAKCLRGGNAPEAAGGMDDGGYGQ